MNEDDYLKMIINKITIDGIKKTMLDIYKENIKTANPEVKNWIASLAKPIPLYDLDENKIEEEIPEPVRIPIIVKEKENKDMKVLETIKTICKTRGEASLGDIRKYISMEELSVSGMWRILNNLVNNKYIIAKGDNKGRTYVIGG